MYNNFRFIQSKPEVDSKPEMEKLKNEFDELKKDQDDLLELLSDQQLKIGMSHYASL